MYASFVFDYRPLKSEPQKVIFVVGWNKLNYKYDTVSPAASILESKVFINSLIYGAKQGENFMSCDLKDFFLVTLIARPEYMKIHGPPTGFCGW